MTAPPPSATLPPVVRVDLAGEYEKALAANERYGDQAEAKTEYAEREGITPLENAVTELEADLEALYDALAPVLRPEREDDLREALPPSLSALGFQVNRLREVRFRLTEHIQRLDI